MAAASLKTEMTPSSHVFPYRENKGADQLHGNRAADQRLCFCCIQSLYFVNPNFQASSNLGCIAWFVSELVGNPDDKFSHDTAQ